MVSGTPSTVAAPGDRSDRAEALAVVSVLLGLAAMWHVLSSPINASPATQVVLAAGIAAAIAWPGSPAALGILSIGVLATVWSEAPFLGNHWLLAGFVALGVLGSIVGVALRGRLGDRDLLAASVLPMARLCLLGFYAVAAFAKLNSAFFDRTVSCGVVYFRESTESIGLAGLQAGGNAGVEWAVIVGTAAIELSIPVLLLWPRTRVRAVVLALGFHGVLALDRAHVFVDFSSLLAVLFVCFLPVSSVAGAARSTRAWVRGTSTLGPHVPHAVWGVAAAVPSALVAGVASRELDPRLVEEVRWWSWQVATLALLFVVGRHVWRRRPRPDERVLDLRPVALAVVPLLVVVNGLTPYLEVKTGQAWNMYANLRTVDGDSNHLVVRRTAPLADDGDDDPVRIVETSDPVLRVYADRGYTVSWRSLRGYLAERPATALTYERGDERIRLRRADEDPELVTAPPEWQSKLVLDRAADGGSPERCQTAFLPLG